MAQTKPKAAQFYGVSDNGTDGQFLKTDGTGGMSWDSPITNPTITSIDYPGSATATDPAGGESVIINGTLFASGITCTVGGTSAVTAFNSATQITITTPAKAAGQYTVEVTNPDGGTASQANFIQYSGVPVWTTAAGNIGSVQSGSTASFQVTATEGSDTIEYAVTTGTLPTGLSLATATGAITGTAGSVSASTTTTFSITATDDENQTSSARSFNITVTPDLPSNHFNIVLYTGDGASSRSITGVGFAPNLTWTKKRGPSTADHLLQNTVQGAGTGSALYSSSNGVAGSKDQYGYISAFGTDGVTYQAGSNGSYPSDLNNENNSTYVAWNFKAGGAATTIAANTVGNTIASDVSVNNTLGFSIVKYDGAGLSGSATTVGHGLNAAPELIIIKPYETGLNASSWFVYSSTTGNAKELYLNTTSSEVSDGNRWNSTSPSSTVFTLGSSFSSYPSYYGGDTIAYCFKSKPGFSKVGSYFGTGASGNNVSIGFEPAFIMIKSISSSGTAWNMWDNKRTPVDMLRANTAESEFAGPGRIQFFANGFQLLDADASRNANGGNYIYLAFAADPSTTTPSLANSFATDLYTGSNSSQSVSIGFATDLVFTKSRNGANNWGVFDSVRGPGQWLQSNTNDRSYSGTYGVEEFNSNNIKLYGGFTPSNYAGQNYVSYSWKAGGTPSINADGSITSVVSVNQAAGFSIVNYTGNATNSSIGHGLSVLPEMVFYKDLSAANNWTVYAEPITVSKYLKLNANTAETTDSYNIFNGNPTTSLLNIGSGNSINTNSNNYIAYCFTSIAGYSKVGSYVGTGSAGNPQNVGFAPSFVLLKMTTSTESWWVFDTDRPDKRLEPNSSDVEANETRFTFTSTGFSFTSGWSNDSGETFIYLAIKEN